MGDRRGNVGIATLCVGGALLLVGCAGSGDGATPLPTPTTQAASPTQSTKPTTARQQVEAAVRAYYAAMDLAIRTGDTSPYEAATTAGCSCRTFVSDVNAIFRAGATRGAAIDLKSVDRVIGTGKHTYDVETIADVSAYEEVDSDGRAKKRFDGHTDKRLLALVQTGGTYRVDAVVFEGRI